MEIDCAFVYLRLAFALQYIAHVGINGYMCCVRGWGGHGCLRFDHGETFSLDSIRGKCVRHERGAEMDGAHRSRSSRMRQTEARTKGPKVVKK
jgi:hypothetical protein